MANCTIARLLTDFTGQRSKIAVIIITKRDEQNYEYSLLPQDTNGSLLRKKMSDVYGLRMAELQKKWPYGGI